MAEYSFTLPSLFPNADPQAVGERLEALADKHGGAFTKDDVLRDAQKTTSALNACFEWNDRDAAEKFRKHQASALLSALLVTKRGKPATRAYVFTATGYDDKSAYVTLQEVLQTPSMRYAHVERGQRQLKRLVAQYREYPELRPIMRQLDRALRRLTETTRVSK